MMYHKDEMNQWFQEGNESAASGHEDGQAAVTTLRLSKREFERMLFTAIKLFDNDDGSYEDQMESISLVCSDEQWGIACNTLDMIRDPEFIKGELPADYDMIVSNHWQTSAPDGESVGVETITAAAFMRDGYAEKIGRGECEVIYASDKVLRVTYAHGGGNDNHKLHFEELDDSFNVSGFTPLNVTWLSPQPTSAGVQGAAAGEDVFIGEAGVREGDEIEAALWAGAELMGNVSDSGYEEDQDAGMVARDAIKEVKALEAASAGDGSGA